jgi:hypothetical protein
MPDLSLIPEHARRAVRKASRSGALDRGELTMNAARQAVCASMGLRAGALNGDDARKAVKRAVQDALVSGRCGGGPG